MSIPEESSTQQPTDAAAHLPSQQQRSSHLSSEGDWTDDTPVAVDPPPPGTSTRPTTIGMASSVPSPLAVTVPIEFEGMDVDIPLNDLSEDDEDDSAAEAAGFASQSSVGSLSLDDHLAAVSSAAAEHAANDDEVSTTSAGTGAGSTSTSTTRGRRPSFQTHRRPSQRRRSSATSFEMHDSLIFEELNKLVEDDTESSDEEEEKGGDENTKVNDQDVNIPATSSSDQGSTPIDAIETTASGRCAGRRVSSRSLASVIEDMELNEGNCGDDDDNAKVGKKMPVVMQLEQRILDRLEQQDDKRSLVRTRSEASLLSGRSVGGSRRGSGSRLGADLPASSSASRNNDPQYTIQQGNRSLRGSRAVQSERVLTDRAREAWPKIHMEATSGEDQVGDDDDKKKNAGKSGKDAASNKFSIKSWFRGLGRKNS